MATGSVILVMPMANGSSRPKRREWQRQCEQGEDIGVDLKLGNEILKYRHDS